MKKLIPVVVMAVSAMMMVGCNDTKKKMPVVTVSDSIRTSEDDNDTTVYGVCGEGSSMHMIQLITDSGDTIEYMFGIEDDNPVQGGLLEGDRMAVCGYKTEDGSLVANKIINLTTLLGKWVSLDKNFEIEEGVLFVILQMPKRILGMFGKSITVTFYLIGILLKLQVWVLIAYI